MKYCFITFLTFSICTTCFAQELTTVRDTVNHVEIGIPTGWRFAVPKHETIVLVAVRQKQNEQDHPKENLNINIIHDVKYDFEQSYTQFVKSIGEAEEFNIINQGDTMVNNRKYKYLVETHLNHINKEKMTNHVLFTNNNGKVLILTMVTTTDNFAKFSALFNTIASSLKY